MIQLLSYKGEFNIENVIEFKPKGRKYDKYDEQRYIIANDNLLRRMMHNPVWSEIKQLNMQRKELLKQASDLAGKISARLISEAEYKPILDFLREQAREIGRQVREKEKLKTVPELEYLEARPALYLFKTVV